jgi:hypothetical protein
MATSLFIEEETGTFTGRLHPHNGYYAGDFSAASPTPDPAPTILTFPVSSVAVRMAA